MSYTYFVFIIVGLVAVVGIGLLLSYVRQIDELNRKIKWAQKRHYTLLRILVPKNNDKSPLAAEQMFAALHGIYSKGEVLQEHFSIEIAATTQSINFYVLVPTHMRDFIEGQIYAQYPTVEIEATTDYANVPLEGKALVGADLVLTKSDYFPIRTFVNFDVDPLAGITGVLSKVDPGEMLSIQAVLSPIDDTWQKEGIDYVKKVKDGQSVKPPDPLLSEVFKQFRSLSRDVATGVLQSATGQTTEVKKEEKKEVKLSGPEEVALKGIESKVTKLGFSLSLRVLAMTNDETLSQTRIQSVVGAFKQFNLSNLNGFEVGTLHKNDPEFLRTYRSRRLGPATLRLNVEEIASIFHFPGATVETPNIVWAGSKKGEPPQNLPIEGEIPANELTTFGLTSFRNRRIKFGIKSNDRRLHFYAIGKTGTGKSTLIENMIYDDIREGRGVAVVDPHGELIEHILNFIPEERIHDVVYFNPDDREHPLAFNLLESVDAEMHSIVASGLMSIFTKLWANVWSARMEYILRNAILGALAIPNATLLSIMRLLNDPVYRKYAYGYITDPVVKDFFINEYDKYDAKFRQEAIAPIQNKVGQFLSSSTIRNVVGQPKSTFNLEEIMNTGKIFLVDLSIGRIGEDNSKLLGSMMITKIQLAAMGRAKMRAEDRRDFYLYVDEFQNFATDSFATILSEARKYKLNLVLVNQYIAQIPEVVADAIFGNVGTMISFRVGATDAATLVKEFAPVFDENDMVNLPNRQIYVKMAIDGVTSQAFSSHTLPPKGIVNENADQIIEASRQRYSRPRAAVEKEIIDIAEADYRPPQEKQHEEIREMPFVIDGTLYKEFSAKGGQRWYFGQPPEVLTEEEAKLAGVEYKGPPSEEQGEENKGQELESAVQAPDGDVEQKQVAPQPVTSSAPTVPSHVASSASALEERPNITPTPVVPTQPTPLPSASFAEHELIPAPATPEIITQQVAREEQSSRNKRRRDRNRKEASNKDQMAVGRSVNQPPQPRFVQGRGQETIKSEGLSTNDRIVPNNMVTNNQPLPAESYSVASSAYPRENNPPQSRGEGSEQTKSEELFPPVYPREEVVPQAPVAINRGHQHDDWLPIDEI